MKRNNKFWILALLVLSVVTLIGCSKKYTLRVSSQDIRFNLEAGSETIEVTADCPWTVNLKDDEDWYTITPMNGENNGTITVTVKAYPDGDYRSTSFIVTSPNGRVRRTVFVSQNILNYYNMFNKVYGISEVEHWNTDFFDQIIEDSYKHFEYDPYDTATGYTMYFLDNGTGVQMDHHEDTAVYFPFTYEYDPVNQIFHIEFETVTEEHENYDPQVLTASDSLYRFMHEYKPNWWERADMRKIGTINPNQKAWIKQAAAKRKKGGPIFQF